MMTHQDKKQAFEQAYSELFDMLYRYVFTRVRHSEDAEDLVSKIMMEAYRGIDKYEPEKGNFEQWLIGIARFRIIDYWRAKKVVLDIDDAFKLVDVMELSQNTDHIDNKMAFEQIMGELPADVQKMLRLRYVDDLSYQEIAEMTNKKPATVRKFFSRLHQKLEEDFNDLSPAHV